MNCQTNVSASFRAVCGETHVPLLCDQQCGLDGAQFLGPKPQKLRCRTAVMKRPSSFWGFGPRNSRVEGSGDVSQGWRGNVVALSPMMDWTDRPNFARHIRHLH